MSASALISPLEQLSQPADGFYMALIDRDGKALGECTNSGSIRTAFASVPISIQPNANVHAVVLDPESGKVLYERADKAVTCSRLRFRSACYSLSYAASYPVQTDRAV